MVNTSIKRLWPPDGDLNRVSALENADNVLPSAALGLSHILEKQTSTSRELLKPRSWGEFTSTLGAHQPQPVDRQSLAAVMDSVLHSAKPQRRQFGLDKFRCFTSAKSHVADSSTDAFWRAWGDEGSAYDPELTHLMPTEAYDANLPDLYVVDHNIKRQARQHEKNIEERVAHARSSACAITASVYDSIIALKGGELSYNDCEHHCENIILGCRDLEVDLVLEKVFEHLLTAENVKPVHKDQLLNALVDFSVKLPESTLDDACDIVKSAQGVMFFSAVSVLVNCYDNGGEALERIETELSDRQKARLRTFKSRSSL